MREPTIAWWPNRISAGTVSRELGSTMDLFATFHQLAGIELPTDRVLDSHDLTPVLLENGKGNREVVFYYRGYRLMAVRSGPWKMHLMTQDGYGEGAREPITHDPPLLFNLDVDPSEKWDVADAHPEVLQMVKQEIDKHSTHLEPAISQLEL